MVNPLVRVATGTVYNTDGRMHKGVEAALKEYVYLILKTLSVDAATRTCV